MRSKLAFPSGGMETKYVWDRHNIQNNGIYKWDKHTYYDETRYYWDKYSTIQKTEFKWDKYSVVNGAKGEYIETITAVGLNSYPQSGIQGGYWYEYVVEGTWYWNQYGTKNQYIWNAYTPLRGKVKQYSFTRYRAVQPYVEMSHSCHLYDEDGTAVLESILITDDSPEVTFYVYEDDGSISEKTANFRSILQGFFEDIIDYRNYQYYEPDDKSFTIEFYKYNKIGFFKYDNQLYTIGSSTSLNCNDVSLPHNERTIFLYGVSKVLGYTTLPKPVSWVPYDETIHNRYSGWYEPSLHIYDTDHSMKNKNYAGTTETYGFFYYETPDAGDYQMIMLSEANAYGTTEETDYLSTCYHRGYYDSYIFEDIKVTEWYYSGDTFLQEVTSESSTAFPKDNVANNIYYDYVGTRLIQDENNYIGVVTAISKDAYPYGGVEGSYYYEYDYFEDNRVTKDAYLETIYDVNRNAYPDDFYNGDYWYVYKESQIHPVIDVYIETVNAETINAYPKDGITGGYWYVYVGFENNGPYKSRWIDEVETNNKNTYPTDGISGNYWYVYKKSYEGYKLQITDAEIKGGIDYNLDVNPEEDYIVGTVASAEIAFEYNNINRDIQQYIDANECIYYTWQPADNDWRQIGIFYLEDVTEVRDTVKVKAYDSIIKTETYIDELIESINDWPCSTSELFGDTCNYLGLNGIVDNSVDSYNYFITDNFEAINITGRQLLQYIAEAAGGLIMANADGALYLTKYRSKNIPLDKSKYVRYVKHNYSTQPIEGVNVRITSDDMGITAGADSGNVYIIENNPLFFNTTDSGTIAAVNNLYNRLKDVSYVPAEVELLQDFGINCGDIITVDEDTFYVMSKNLSPSGCKLKCVGNKHRQLKESGLNSDIIALRGKTNELYRDLEQTRSTLTDIGADLRTEISQTAEEIKLYASNLNNSLNSSVSIKLDSITSEVNNLDKELSSRIEQTESSISSTVTEQGRVITQIQQDLDGIDLVYNSENGTASITIGDITVTDLVNGEYVTRTVAGIDLTGYVTFHSLETAGATTINGSNITTGTISAERINMTGAITWGDLSSDVQDYIDAGVSGDVDIPDYIKSTYIDGARIESPTINGGTLNSVAAYGDATHTTTIEDSQISFNIKEYSSSGGSFGYKAGVIDAYVNDTGMPDSARTGLRIESYSDGSSYSGGLSLIANRGLVLQSKDQDIFFYLPGRNPVALSTILDKLGL